MRRKNHDYEKNLYPQITQITQICRSGFNPTRFRFDICCRTEVRPTCSRKICVNLRNLRTQKGFNYMTQHAAILPILIPFAAALLQLAAKGYGIAVQRAIGLSAALLGVAAAVWLVALADAGVVLVYELGN